ncbi:AAA family ATPase [Clostridium sp. ZBS15]|uniref:McrB family protein n=1 Tax=Clostridium sp. ZBS15 TaxID=2949969 RepID=UPI00207A9058|nr:AAA family ATPase [Clostridium sp. ZBS15]
MKANDTLEKFKVEFEQDENLQDIIRELRENNNNRNRYTSTVDATMFILLGFEFKDKEEDKKSYIPNFINKDTCRRNVASILSTKESDTSKNLKLLTSDIKEDIFNIDRSKVSFNDLQKKLEEMASKNENINKKNIPDILKCVEQIIGLNLYKFTDNDGYINGENNDMNFEEQIKNLINNGVNQIILTGAPGTGKTFIAKKIANSIGKELNWKKDKDDTLMKYEFVQFHPSYDYTDFVEGLRPVEINGNVTFKKVDGIFKAFCRRVIENKNNGQEDREYYFFIIDEINRADLSKVLGELMYGLEKDKRGQENKINTQYQNLPTFDIDTKENIDNSELGDVFKEGFYIPENIIIIGTMNDIDRSVESMDFALRRRFEWKEFIVEKDMLKNSFEQQNEDETYAFGEVIYKNADKLADRIMCLNGIIKKDGASFSLNRQYFISQGYFANLPQKVDQYNFEEIDDIIKYVWKYRLETLIREYVRGENTLEVEKFIEQCRNSMYGNIENKPNENKNASDGEANS